MAHMARQLLAMVIVQGRSRCIGNTSIYMAASLSVQCWKTCPQGHQVQQAAFPAQG